MIMILMIQILNWMKKNINDIELLKCRRYMIMFFTMIYSLILCFTFCVLLHFMPFSMLYMVLC
jgi:hypothetical protein